MTGSLCRLVLPLRDMHRSLLSSREFPSFRIFRIFEDELVLPCVFVLRIPSCLQLSSAPQICVSSIGQHSGSVRAVGDGAGPSWAVWPSLALSITPTTLLVSLHEVRPHPTGLDLFLEVRPLPQG